MDPWEQFALAHVASKNIQDDRERSQRKLRESFADHMDKIRETTAPGTAHPYITYVPGTELNIKLRNSGTTLHAVQYGLYDKVRGVDMPGVRALRDAPKLTAAEEDKLRLAFQIQDEVMDVLNIGEELVDLDDIQLSAAVNGDADKHTRVAAEIEQYKKVREKVHALGHTAYKVIGLLSAKKNGSGSLA